MRYLLIGISSILLSSCIKEYVVSAEWMYINDTNHTIESISQDTFILEPNSSYLIEEQGKGPNVVTAETYLLPIFTILRYDDLKCDTVGQGSHATLGDGPNGINNYESEELGLRFFRFTYRFTEDDYLKAEDCN